jgi:hypothetical protein
MPQQWTPLRDYTGYQHVLWAQPCYVHLLNGNVYYVACEQKAGKQQNLAIYRELGGTLEWQHVVTFQGTIDAQAFITPGGCVIGQGGALIVATSLQPIGVPFVTTTGYQGVRCRIPGIDQPWSLGAIEQRLTAIETALGNLDSVGLDARYTVALERLCGLLGI